MTIEDQVSHLACLTMLLDFHEKLGGTRNKWVLAEFHRLNDELIEALKEKHDETRKADSVRPSGSEDRTNLPSSEPGSGSRFGEGDWASANVPRSRIPSPDAG